MALEFDSKCPASVSRTQQHFKKSCDVKNIVERYRKTGVLPVSGRNGMFGDFSDIGDFHEVSNRIIEANKRFMSLPGKVRDYFKGDVGALLAFVGNPDNVEKARELGLLPAKSADEINAERIAKEEAAAASKAAGTAGTAV